MTMFPLLLAARLDWGFGNPNKTAAFIALLMVGVWVLPFIQRQLFWLALLLFTGLGVCLMQTASRGGLVAVTVGLAALLSRCPRPWPRAYLVGSVLAVWAIVGTAVWLETTHRFSQGIGTEDLSITHRLLLWKVAPRMMVDAPGGWGVGNAGAAFMQWYQPLERTEAYRTLVNSHLTWLVEFGWAGRFLYVFGWLAVLALCWPKSKAAQKSAWLALPLGLWTAFAVAAWFSSVAESPWLWSLPVASLVCVLVWRMKARRWPRRWVWMTAGLGACAVLGAIAVAGLLSREFPLVHFAGSRVVLGNFADPDVWVVANTDTLGKMYGRTLRQYLLSGAHLQPAQGLSVGIVRSVDALPLLAMQSKTLVIAGTLAAPELARLRSLVPSCAQLILLNPIFYPQDLEVGPRSMPKIVVFSGEYSRASSAAWADALQQSPHNVEGAGDFLPHWPELILVNHPTVPR